MSLLTVLKSIGKDLSHVGTWLEDGLKVAATAAAIVDPPLGAIFTEIEAAIEKISSNGVTINSSTLQAIITAIATVEGLKAPAPASSTS